MKRGTFIFLIAFASLLFACSYGLREGTVQKDSPSSIRFTGNVVGTQIQIDSSATIDIVNKDTDEMNAFNPRQLFQVPPGKHIVKVFRAGTSVLEQAIYIGKGEIKEVSVP
jgi:hypothetical protein